MTFNINSGAIIRGDFHNPNFWSYTVVNKAFMRTTKGGYHKMYSPPGVLQNTTTGVMSPGDLSEPPWDRNTVYNMALDRLNDKVRGSLDLSISVFERRQTVRMVQSLVKVIRHAKKTVARAARESDNLPRFRDPTRSLADGWLQYTYGWKPLLSDIFGIADETIRHTLNETQRIRGRAHLPIKGLGYITKNVDACNIARVLSIGEGKQGCMINVSLAPPAKDFEVSRWTSLNPVSIGWELIPYSFVVDWFYDVGSYLRNLETAFLYNSQFRGGYVSELFAYTGDETLNGQFFSAGPGVLDDFSGLDAHLLVRRFQRAPLAAYPFPRAPSIKTDLSGNRLLSAASLLRNLLK